MAEQLIYEISGKRYILIEIPIIEGKHDEAKRFIEKHGMIHQGVKEISRGGWLSKAYVVETFLLPEENFEAYSKDSI